MIIIVIIHNVGLIDNGGAQRQVSGSGIPPAFRSKNKRSISHLTLQDSANLQKQAKLGYKKVCHTLHTTGARAVALPPAPHRPLARGARGG
jgi:hypothetical protein